FAELAIHLGQIGRALLELALELLLRANRRRRFAQHALGVHEADLEIRGERGCAHDGDRQGDRRLQQWIRHDSLLAGATLSEPCPDLELEALYAVALFLGNREGKAELQRPYGGGPLYREPGRVAEALEFRLRSGSVHLASVDEEAAA